MPCAAVFWGASMSDRVLGRGAMRGDWLFQPYPQRRVPVMNWTDRVLRAGAARLALALRPRRLSERRLIAAVAREVADCEALEDGALRDAAQALRPRLLREGLGGGSLIRALALARVATTRELGIAHRPVQVLGAVLLLRGRLLEMGTGEGKSATALLAASVAALAGLSPHVITVNAYLARRDRDAFVPVLDRLGLSAGLVTGDLSPEARRVAYAADVTWVDNKEVAFDYLKDRLAAGRARSAARSTLRRAYGAADDPGALVAPPILDGLRFAIVDEADSIFADEAGTPLIISATSGPEDPEQYLRALDLASRLTALQDFVLVEDERRARLTPAGKARLAKACAPFTGIWQVARAREDRVRQALAARYLYLRDTHYIVAETEDGPAIHIVDEFTGRTMPDRSWEGGLHQMIEVKEGLVPTAPRQTIARITYQRFFRQYLRLSGMTGTGLEIAPEMHTFFDLTTVPVPPHRPSRRRHLGLRCLPDEKAAHRAVGARAADMAARGRAVLIGTRTVAASESLSKVLGQQGVAHRVLNARQDAGEAELIAEAGQAGRVTVATNMAGRGTDIPLGPGVAKAGGLHVILTGYHESRRIDRQLYGRAGRQGDPGSTEDIVARDDPLFARLVPRLQAVLRPLPDRMAVALLRRAMQWRADRTAAARRRDTVAAETHEARAMAFAGREHG